MKKTIFGFLTALLLLTVLSCFCSAGVFADGITVSDITFKSGSNEVFKVFDGKIKSEATVSAGGSGKIYAIAASYTNDQETKLIDVSLKLTELTGEKQTVSTDEINVSKDGVVKSYVWVASTLEPAAYAKKLTNVSCDTRLKDVTFTSGGERYYILLDDNTSTAKAYVKADTSADYSGVPAKIRTMSGDVTDTTLDLTKDSISFKTVAENGDEKEYSYSFAKTDLSQFWNEKWTGAEMDESTFFPTNGTFVRPTAADGNVIKPQSDADYKWTSGSRTSNDKLILAIKKWTDAYTGEGSDNDVLAAKRSAWDYPIYYRLKPYGVGISIAEVDIYPTCEFKFNLGGPGFIVSGGNIYANTADNYGADFGTTKTTFTGNTWHHVCLVLEKAKASNNTGTVSVYIDGKLWGSKDGVTTAAGESESISKTWRPGNMAQAFGLELTSGSTSEIYFDNNRYLGKWN